MPIAWDELSSRLQPTRFTVRSAPRRLARLASDPWADYWTSSQQIADEAFAVVSRL
ncbi:MAG: hypothetical protein LC791_16205 [Acidobacteria bacterium]|nr:hypothetical protein [Acidobacteriota bacterium]